MLVTAGNQVVNIKLNNVKLRVCFLCYKFKYSSGVDSSSAAEAPICDGLMTPPPLLPPPQVSRALIMK